MPCQLHMLLSLSGFGASFGQWAPILILRHLLRRDRPTEPAMLKDRSPVSATRTGQAHGQRKRAPVRGLRLPGHAQAAHGRQRRVALEAACRATAVREAHLLQQKVCDIAVALQHRCCVRLNATASGASRGRWPRRRKDSVQTKHLQAGISGNITNAGPFALWTSRIKRGTSHSTSTCGCRGKCSAWRLSLCA